MLQIRKLTVVCAQSDRYREQKRRIKSAGVRKCFYLAEERYLGEDEVYETFLKAIQTSISQTQVVEYVRLYSYGQRQRSLFLRAVTSPCMLRCPKKRRSAT